MICSPFLTRITLLGHLSATLRSILPDTPPPSVVTVKCVLSIDPTFLVLILIGLYRACGPSWFNLSWLVEFMFFCLASLKMPYVSFRFRITVGCMHLLCFGIRCNESFFYSVPSKSYEVTWNVGTFKSSNLKYGAFRRQAPHDVCPQSCLWMAGILFTRKFAVKPLPLKGRRGISGNLPWGLYTVSFVIPGQCELKHLKQHIGYRLPAAPDKNCIAGRLKSFHMPSLTTE